MLSKVGWAVAAVCLSGCVATGAVPIFVNGTKAPKDTIARLERKTSTVDRSTALHLTPALLFTGRAEKSITIRLGLMYSTNAPNLVGLEVSLDAYSAYANIKSVEMRLGERLVSGQSVSPTTHDSPQSCSAYGCTTRSWNLIPISMAELRGLTAYQSVPIRLCTDIGCLEADLWAESTLGPSDLSFTSGYRRFIAALDQTR